MGSERKYYLVESIEAVHGVKLYGQTELDGKILVKVDASVTVKGKEISPDEIRSITHPVEEVKPKRKKG